MKVVSNLQVIDKYLKILKEENFYYNPKYDYELVLYEKGETMISPNFEVHDIYYIVSGNIKLYSIKEDGSGFSVTTEGKGSILGDMEFVRNYSSLFVEATTDVYCFRLSFLRYRQELEQDAAFLLFLLQRLAGMYEHQFKMDLEPKTLEDKVLIYLREMEPTHSIYKIESVVNLLHCNRRQLQRVLKSLCDRNIIQKVGKGHYELI